MNKADIISISTAASKSQSKKKGFTLNAVTGLVNFSVQALHMRSTYSLATLRDLPHTVYCAVPWVQLIPHL